MIICSMTYELLSMASHRCSRSTLDVYDPLSLICHDTVISKFLQPRPFRPCFPACTIGPVKRVYGPHGVLSLWVGPRKQPYRLMTPRAYETVFRTHFYRVCLGLPPLRACELPKGKVLLSESHNPAPMGSVPFWSLIERPQFAPGERTPGVTTADKSLFLEVDELCQIP